MGATGRVRHRERLLVDRTEADKTTLSEVLSRYASEVTPSKKGAKSELWRIEALRRSDLAGLRMSAVTGVKVATWRDERLKVVSPSTVLRDLNLLGHVIQMARREWGIALSENVAWLVRKPRAAPARTRRLVVNEEPLIHGYYDDPGKRDADGKFIGAHSRNAFMGPIVTIALETAMRQAEIAGMQWQHVDFVNQVLTLPTTKNNSPRSVPLTVRATAVLKELGPRAEGPVFPGLTAEAIKQSFRRCVSALGLVDLRFHDLRHEATSRLFEKGLNPMEVASVTGHKTMQMLKRYTHFSVAHLVGKIG